MCTELPPATSTISWAGTPPTAAETPHSIPPAANSSRSSGEQFELWIIVDREGRPGSHRLELRQLLLDEFLTGLGQRLVRIDVDRAQQQHAVVQLAILFTLDRRLEAECLVLGCSLQRAGDQVLVAEAKRGAQLVREPGVR